MSNILQPADIIDIGIEKEKKRRDFYAIAADKFKDNLDLAELFGKLRDWEEDHITRFEEIRSEVTGGHYAESFPGEIEAYMQALVDNELYSDITPEGFANIVKDPGDALDIGIRFEKDAILFFNGLSRFVDEKMQKITKKLIEEEQQHLIYLHNMKNDMGL
ncbi:MAG: ferritin family protein [Candidatus Krumholzibacteria bacterium]|nr:ferritin family protein [Candidatus Krumholzibacteria bacterium]